MRTISNSPAALALILTLGITSASRLCFAAAPNVQVTVDYAVDKGASNQLASGFLHGISDPEPDQYLIDGVKVTAIRGADHHLNAPSLFDPTTYARVSQTGAKLMVGLYYYSSNPSNTYWPGDNGDYATWRSIVANVYDEAKTKGFNVYSWITWNEPTLQWRTTARPIAHYMQAHLNAFQVIKGLNPSAKIQAPENNSYNFSFITEFLTFCKTNNCLPDVLSWHELTSGDVPDIEAHTAQIKAWMSSNNISPIPIAVTEYAGGSYANPSTYDSGKVVHYIAKLERSAVNGVVFGLKSEWDYVGSDPKFLATLGDSADIPSASLPAGLWWVYHSYSEMTGRLVKITSSNPTFIDTLAASHSQMKRSVILLGSQDASTTANVTLSLQNLNIAAYLVNSGKIHLRMEDVSAANIVYKPTVALEGDYTVTNNAVTLTLPSIAIKHACTITVTPATASAPAINFEAESLTPSFTAGRNYSIFSQAGSSGGSFGSFSATAVGDFIKYSINVPAAGVYNLRAGLHSESSAAILQLYVRGVAYGGPKDEFGASLFYSTDFGNILLPSGNTTLEFRVVGKNGASSGYSMMFDNFLLVGPLGSASSAPQVYQSEDGTWDSSGVVETTNPGWTGTGYVNTGNAIGAFSQVTVNVPTAGSYTLDFRYSNGNTSDRPGDLSVNGTVVQAGLSFPATGAWTTWSDIVVTKALAAGSNTVRVTATTANGCANLDKVTIQ